jgi:SNF2 family DNA or RNA helicase
MAKVNAGFIWFMTSTFDNLDNIRSNGLIRDCMHGAYQYLLYFLVKNDDEYVVKSFTMPSPHIFHHKCRNPNIIRVVRDIVPANIMNMIEGGNIQGAIQQLGGEETDDHNIVSLITRKKKEELHEAEEKENKYKKLEHSSTKSERDRYLMWSQKKKSLESQLKCVEERFAHILDNDCPICQSTIQNPVMVPCCQNIFCGECIIPWLQQKGTCPFCRTMIEAKKLIFISKSSDEKKDDGTEEKKDEEKKDEKVSNLTKPEMILNIISQNPQGKFIVFSNYDESYILIKNTFTEHNQKCIEIRGTVAMRTKSLKRYEEGEVNVIFLNSMMNGAGINLEMTTDIIMYHEMTELLEKQLIGRANRIGRTSELNIHYLE